MGGAVLSLRVYMTLRFKCHINVEACVSAKSAKYLYKYVTKGGDRAMVRTEGDAPDAPNEIDDYQDMRSIGASEGCWRLYEFEMGDRYPAVEVLQVHLEDQHTVVYAEGAEESVAENADKRKTTHTAFFDYNRDYPQCDCLRSRWREEPVIVHCILTYLFHFAMLITAAYSRVCVLGRVQVPPPPVHQVYGFSGEVQMG